MRFTSMRFAILRLCWSRCACCFALSRGECPDTEPSSRSEPKQSDANRGKRCNDEQDSKHHEADLEIGDPLPSLVHGTTPRTPPAATGRHGWQHHHLKGRWQTLREGESRFKG